MKTRIDNYYNEIASGYNELHKEEQLKKLNFASQFIKPIPGERLLDVGCGTGISTEYWDCQKYGIDPSEKLLEIAKKNIKNNSNNPRTDYLIAPAEKIPYPNDFFDYVISITAIQNFEDIEQGLQEMKRVLKKNGTILITTLKDSQKLVIIEKLIHQEFFITESHKDDIEVFFMGNKK